jgi:predicted RNA-binding protein with PIN domain
MARCAVTAPFRRGTHIARSSTVVPFVPPAARGRGPRSARSLPANSEKQFSFSGPIKSSAATAPSFHHALGNHFVGQGVSQQFQLLIPHDAFCRNLTSNLNRHRTACQIRFSISCSGHYRRAVALVRILIDGYSLLHGWPDLAPGQPRHSAAAREELIYSLTQYRDAVGTPITVIFDGGGARPGTPKIRSSPEMEILYSKAGQTADEMIERAAHRLTAFGEVLVVTDDVAERETVYSVGGMASTCANFIQTVRSTLQDLQRDLKYHNRRELSRFKDSRKP